MSADCPSGNVTKPSSKQQVWFPFFIIVYMFSKFIEFALDQSIYLVRDLMRAFTDQTNNVSQALLFNDNRYASVTTAWLVIQ